MNGFGYLYLLIAFSILMIGCTNNSSEFHFKTDDYKIVTDKGYSLIVYDSTLFIFNNSKYNLIGSYKKDIYGIEVIFKRPGSKKEFEEKFGIQFSSSPHHRPGGPDDPDRDGSAITGQIPSLNELDCCRQTDCANDGQICFWTRLDNNYNCDCVSISLDSYIVCPASIPDYICFNESNCICSDLISGGPGGDSFNDIIRTVILE